MKKILYVLPVFLVLLVLVAVGGESSHYRQFDDVAQLQAFLRYNPDQPLISAHRGGPEPGYPENCIETFEHTLTYAPCLLEIDVRLSRDSVLVLMHDDTLDRTTTGTGIISDYTLAELKALYLKDNEGNVTEYRIPTFAEALEWACGKTVLQVDVKQDVPPEMIVKAIQQHQAETCAVVITYDLESALTYHRLHPHLLLSTSIRSERDLQQLQRAGIPPDHLMAFVGVSSADPRLYQMLHEYGIRPIQGTMGDLDKRAESEGIHVYQRLLEAGASVLATDNVPLATQALQAYRAHQK
ncbi:MAG: glycerophosphodiester phosphodiesterase [Gemmatimonadetes bacterium]|nr:MAG: glycerophosphodiester phosphodiesterase [Gemmatimonadota bacterium]